jgi:4-amino-4-deoxy-L-arabinose transferase-like glycosyltransferase
LIHRRKISAWLGAAIVVVAFGLPLFIDLGATDFKGDEPIYAFSIDRMLDDGDWLTPKAIPSDEMPFLEKPPLKFWFVAASVRSGLFPRNEFGYRLWDVLFGIAAFLYVYAIGLRLSGIVCGLTAVLVLFGHQPLVLDHGLRSNNMEAALVLAYCGGMFHAIAWSEAQSRGRRRGHALLVGLWFAFGFMMKFIAAIFLPAALVIMAVVSRRWRTRLLADWRIWTAVSAVTAALILPWFVYQFRLRGHEFWAIIFGRHILVRFTAYLDPAHVHPWYFYLTTMAREFSWSQDLALVCAGLLLLAYQAIRRHSDGAALMLVWVVLPLAVISAGTSKLYHYVFPFLPPLALGVGLLPMAIATLARSRQEQIARLLERIWPARVSARIPTWLRTALTAIAAIAILVAVATPIFGSVWIRIAGVTVFRNSTISRPLVVATLLLATVGLFRIVPMALVFVLLLVALPFDAYRNVKALEVAQARQDGAPMRQLRECLLDLQRRGAPAGVYVHTADGGQWKYVYYLRSPGWRTDEAADDGMLRDRLLTPAAERPVFLSEADYARFRRTRASKPDDAGEIPRLDATRRIVFDDGQMLMLPGPYAVCGDVKGGSVRVIR